VEWSGLVDASVRQVDARLGETRAAISLVDASLRLVVADDGGAGMAVVR
jgi:hypothetical protein